MSHLETFFLTAKDSITFFRSGENWFYGVDLFDSGIGIEIACKDEYRS